MSHDYVPRRTRNPTVTTSTPWSTATAHLSHCKAQTETFVLICHMPMFQEKLSNPFTLFTFIIIVYQILNFYFSLKWTFPLNMDFVRNFLFIIVFLTFVFVYLTKWILNLNIEFRISSFLWSGCKDLNSSSDKIFLSVDCLECPVLKREVIDFLLISLENPKLFNDKLNIIFRPVHLYDRFF